MSDPLQPVFCTTLPVRIDDLIGGVHVGNSSLVGYINEAQMQLYAALGFPQLTVDGCMPITREMRLGFLAELRYGQSVDLALAITDVGERDYRLQVRMARSDDGRPVCEAELRMKFIDMGSGRSAPVPPALVAAWQRFVAGRS